ncbi:MAG: calcium/sodium antiporter, partial [Hyphomicrobiales bacterium]|nr:calcium/sodium antiporter [Hyphomicrobiales bacterium]
SAFGISDEAIGLTVVAVGTSLPELATTLTATLRRSSAVAIGNVVGSNIANSLLVLGLPAIVAATSISEEGTVRTSLFLIVVTLVFIAFCLNGPLNWFDGLVLLSLLTFFLVDSVRAVKRHRRRRARNQAAHDLETVDGIEGVPHSSWATFGFLIIGLIGLPLGARLTIDGAIEISAAWGVTEAAIGLTVVALGTSLPELAATLMAAIRRAGNVALGNIIGSNIFNLLAIIGTTAVVVPIPIPDQILHVDLWMMLLATAFLLPFGLFHVRVTRLIGILLALAYAVYIIMVFHYGVVA